MIDRPSLLGHYREDQSNICGYADGPGLPTCDAPGVWHGLVWHDSWEAMTSCAVHLVAMELTADHVHAVEPVCELPESWFDPKANRCFMPDGWDAAASLLEPLKQEVQ